MTSSHPAPLRLPRDLPRSPHALVEIGSDVVAMVRLARRPAASAPLRPPPPADRPSLTEAEREVMQAIFDGKSNDAIARERGRSARTVANQVASIFRKHGVGSRSELVAQYVAVDT